MRRFDMSKKNMGWAISVSVAISFVSCVSTGVPGRGMAHDPIVPDQQNAKAIAFSTIPDKAVVYVYRSCFAYPERRALIVVDKKNIGFNVACRFFRIELPPGKHQLVSKFEWLRGLSTYELVHTNPDHYRFVSRAEDESIVDLEMEAGKLYFLRLDVDNLSIIGMLDLHLVVEEKGREEIFENKYRLLEIPSELPELSPEKK